MTEFTNTNAWFYTLSTIAQTCGAIIALGGAFVVFQLQRLDPAVGNYKGRLMEIILILRKGTRAYDEYFRQSEEDVLKEYKLIKSSNTRDDNLGIFDNSDLLTYYLDKEGLRLSYLQQDGSRIASNGRVVNRSEIIRWCDSMASLLNENIANRKRVYAWFFPGIILLASSILFSVILLPANLFPFEIDYKIYMGIAVILGLVSICYSAISIWRISLIRPKN